MMKSIYTYIVLAFAVLAFASCDSQGSDSTAPNIIFAISDGLEGFETKTAITDDNLASNTVKAYATRNSVAVDNMNPTLLTKQTSGFWKPSPAAVQWQDGGSYKFIAYAYTNSGITDVADNGLSFSVEQPSSYDAGLMADYVVSKELSLTVAEANKHPLIVLDMDHVLPAVEIYVTKDPSLQYASVASISLSGLYYSADMEYNTATEKWVNSPKNTRSAEYKLSGTFDTTSERSTTSAKMSLITVPQSLTQSCVLTVKYTVDEGLGEQHDYKTYSESFTLSDFFAAYNREAEFTSGNRTVFHLKIDTGIHLSATIAAWKKVDFIEGTVLPAIK